MKERRLGRAATVISAIFLAGGCTNAAQINPEPTPIPYPCKTGEINPHEKAVSRPYTIVNGLPENKILIVDPYASKIYLIPKYDTGKRIILSHKPNLEIVFENDNRIKFAVDCVSKTLTA